MIKTTGMANPTKVINVDSFGLICPAMYAAILNPAAIKLIGIIRREKKYLSAAMMIVLKIRTLSKSPYYYFF